MTMLTGCQFRRGCVTREEFLDLLARLRCAPVGRARLRAPHKPLLLLWLPPATTRIVGRPGSLGQGTALQLGCPTLKTGTRGVGNGAGLEHV